MRRLLLVWWLQNGRFRLRRRRLFFFRLRLRFDGLFGFRHFRRLLFLGECGIHGARPLAAERGFFVRRLHHHHRLQAVKHPARIVGIGFHPPPTAFWLTVNVLPLT